MVDCFDPKGQPRPVMDAIGQPLEEGDTVAYVYRVGSDVSINPRIIVNLDEGRELDRGRIQLNPLSTNGMRWVREYNVVKVAS